MTVVTTRIRVAADGAVSLADPLPAGEHLATVTLASTTTTPARPGKPFTMADFPIHDGPWDDSVSLRREDLYGDDGR